MEYLPQKLEMRTEMQIQLCIDRSLNQTPQHMKKKLQSLCAQFKKKYQLDLSYGQDQLGIQLQLLYHKLYEYMEIVQVLLSSYRPCQKLGTVLDIVHNCLNGLFAFLRTHFQEKKNYTQQRLKILQQKFTVQAPGHCNRCHKFILSRDVQQTKVLLTAGQFNDPYNLFDAGCPDFINRTNKQEDQQYKLKYADVWENKKKIQEKFHAMQVEIDKRSYGYTYSVNEMQKIEDVFKEIITEIVSHDTNVDDTEDRFKQNIQDLINNIYKKLLHYKNNVNNKQQAVQVGEEEQAQIWQQLKVSNQKTLKKNKDLTKKLALKEKQLAEMSTKLIKTKEDLHRNLLQKNSFEYSLKNLITQNVDNENQLHNANTELKSNLKKVADLEKQIQYLKLENKKIYDHLENRSFIKKIIKQSNAVKNTNSGSCKDIKDEIEDQKIVHENINQDDVVFERENKRNSTMIRKSIKKSISEMSSKQRQQKQKQINLQIPTASRKNIRKLTSIRQQSSISIPRADEDPLTQPAAHQENKTEVSIGRKEQSNKNIPSMKTKKNLVKSMRKIKRKSSIKKKNTEDKKEDKILNDTQQKIVTKAQTIDKIDKKISTSSQNKQNPSVPKNQQIRNKPKSLSKQKQTQRNSDQSFKQLNETQPINNARKITSLHGSPSQKFSSSSSQLQNITKKYTNISQNGNSNKMNKSSLNSFMRNAHLNSDSSNIRDRSVMLTTVLPNIKQTGVQIQQSQAINNNSLSPSSAYNYLYDIYLKLLSQSLQQSAASQLSSSSLTNKLTLTQFQSQITSFLNYLTSMQLFSLNKDSNLMRSPIINSSMLASMHQNSNNDNEHVIVPRRPLMKINKFQSLYQAKQRLSVQLQQSHNNQLGTIHTNLTGSVHVPKLNQSQISALNTQISQLYLSQQQAYSIQKSASFPFNSYNSLSAFNNMNNSTCSFMMHRKGVPDYNGTKQMIQLLSKAQVKYLKLVTILFAKLHQCNNQVYHVVKKGIIYPYSHGRITNNKENMQNNMNRQIKQRSTVEQSHFKQTKGSLLNRSILLQQKQPKTNLVLRQALIKLILLHRNCRQYQKTNNSPSNSPMKSSSICMSSCMSKICNPLNVTVTGGVQPSSISSAVSLQEICIHLYRFQMQLQNQFGFGTEIANKLSKNNQNQENNIRIEDQNQGEYIQNNKNDDNADEIVQYAKIQSQKRKNLSYDELDKLSKVL